MTNAGNLFAAGLLLATLGSIASAHGQTAQIKGPSRVSAMQAAAAAGTAPSGDGSKIKFGALTAIPNGYYEMCAQRPNLCRVHGGRLAASRDGSVRLTRDTMEQLASTNANVNASIRPVGRDGWLPGRTEGDCKDFALTKRQRLITSGWPTSALPVAIVRTSSGDQHLILVARTNEGDFVLDNLIPRVVPWASAAYSWEKIQSTTDVWAWHTI
jgi:predicted transglutaminase-like cysteine proteinase